jgi:LEA14-like dessication related protein
MSMGRRALLMLLALAVLVSGGCANLQRREPIEVIVVGFEPLQGEGLELRMLVKLRIQNPNDLPVDFTGVSVTMNVQGKRFATGVSGAGGSVPRFGEAIVNVPVSVSVLRIARQTVGVLTNEFRGTLTYEMNGKLAGQAFNAVRFKSNGEFTLPPEITRTRE